MERDLFSADNYGLFTFNTTSHTLKAEKVLKNNGEDILVIPTLREISTSCGLSVKVHLYDLSRLKEILQTGQVPIAAIYEVEKRKGGYLINRIDLE